VADSKIETESDGKRFFGRYAIVNYIII